jgi:RND family efflux transporter MFP subunit
MSDAREMPEGSAPEHSGDVASARTGNAPTGPRTKSPLRFGGNVVLAAALLLLLPGSLVAGALRHHETAQSVAATAEQQRDLVPKVRVAAVRQSDGMMTFSLPATTTAFEAANIFARTSGYIEKRYVDIGDQVKAGTLLAEIIAPELDHQISEAQATLKQDQATLHQTEASRELAQVTNARDSGLVKQGWLTLQQGDNDRLTLAAQEAAVGVAASNVAAQEAQIKVLGQEKDYQRVVAPFDGVVTQRYIDNGSLVQSGSTMMFTMMHSNVIRIQLYVPQDEAFGVEPGVKAVVHVPEIPNRDFPGTVTRIARALQPGSRSLLTEIDVPNPDGALSPGIYCVVDLHVPRKTPSFVVPADAIIFNENGLHVAVVKNGAVHLRKISIARDFGKQVEVRQGVGPGDLVVLNPMVDLADGSRVAAQSGPATS